MGWTEEKPLEDGPGGCNCQTKMKTLGMGDMVAVGFGNSYVMRDDFCIYQENTPHWNPDKSSPLSKTIDVMDKNVVLTVADVEKVAAEDPDHDWRIYWYAPLYEAEYQRHRDGVWYCIKTGDGFA